MYMYMYMYMYASLFGCNVALHGPSMFMQHVPLQQGHVALFRMEYLYRGLSVPGAVRLCTRIGSTNKLDQEGNCLAHVCACCPLGREVCALTDAALRAHPRSPETTRAVAMDGAAAVRSSSDKLSWDFTSVVVGNSSGSDARASSFEPGQVYYNGPSHTLASCGVRLVHGEQGEITGPSTGAAADTQFVVRFSGRSIVRNVGFSAASRLRRSWVVSCVVRRSSTSAATRRPQTAASCMARWAR
jgi:hypothetical protein